MNDWRNSRTFDLLDLFLIDNPFFESFGLIQNGPLFEHLALLEEVHCWNILHLIYRHVLGNWHHSRANYRLTADITISIQIVGVSERIANHIRLLLRKTTVVDCLYLFLRVYCLLVGSPRRTKDVGFNRLEGLRVSIA